MATEDRVKVLEGEFKLIKSELRQTLSSVRDFLLDLKLPPMQEEPGLVKEETNSHDKGPENEPQMANQPFGNGDNGFSGNGMPYSQNDMPDFGGMDQLPQAQQTPEPQASAKEPAAESLPPLDFDEPEDEGMSSGDIPGLVEPKDETEDEIEDADEEQEQDEKEEAPELSEEPSSIRQSSAPQINLLANLIRWVSSAKKEIGASQLPVFLDVYSTTGNLNPEIKEIILHLAEVATNPALADETPENGQIISEQLKLCMEINRSSGQLPDEIKLKVQRLTELLLQQSISYNKADVWSTLLVDLHGILSGGGSALRSLQSTVPAEPDPSDTIDEDQSYIEDNFDESNLDIENEEPKRKEKIFYHEPAKTDPNMLKGTRPARLRLIMPMGEGKEQTLDLGNLFIATGDQPKSENTRKKSASVRK